MRVAYCAPTAAPAQVAAALLAERLPLDELLARSDVVSIHCPLSSDTRGLIGRQALGRMKPSAVLVNTARGPIVDEDALLEALDAGRLLAVGLDVYAREPEIPARLRGHPRALLLPHLGSATVATRARMADLAAQSIADLLDGRRPAHVVNPEVFEP
jgi:glyoxylate reductase